MATPVTDPDILVQLNADSGPKPVTDPALLAQLNGESRPSLLGNEPDDGYLSSAAKGIGTAVVKGLSHITPITYASDSSNLADYLIARAHSAITGKPVDEIMAQFAAQQKERSEGSLLGKIAEFSNPARVLPTSEEIYSHVLKRTGEYVPTTEAGKLGMAGLETAIGMIGPGGGAAAIPRAGEQAIAKQALNTGVKLAPINAAAGAAGQGVTDTTDDPLWGMAAGLVTPVAAERAASAAGKFARGNNFTRPLMEELPVIGRQFEGEQERMVRDRLLAESKDPEAVKQALMVDEQGPLNTENIPGSMPTTPELTGDMGLLGAQREARQFSDDFNVRASDQDKARRGALENLSPDADVMAPSRYFQEQIDALQKSSEEAVNRLKSGSERLSSKLGEGNGSIQNGTDIRDAIQAVEKEKTSLINKLYDAVRGDKGLRVYTAPPREDFVKFVNGINKAGAPLSSTEKTIFGRIKSWGDTTPWEDLVALNQYITSEMSAEMQTKGRSPTWGRLTKANSTVMDAMNKALDNQVAYENAAVAAGKLKPEDTIEGRLGKVHGEYQANPRNGEAEANVGVGTGTPEAGAFALRGEAGEGNGGLGNASGRQGVSEGIQAANPQNLADYPIYYPGGNLRARYEVIDHSDLITSHDKNFNPNPKFPSELQPRARESAPAQDQVNGMAARLQPERLGPSPEANSGAPIIGPDNVVESGNGRALAIGKAYQKGNTAYRQWLESQGFDTTGMNQPVLVARRTSEMTPQQREYFANSANSSAGLKMSAAEQAASDAKVINKSVLDLVADGQIRSAENRDFVRAFADKLPANERGGILDKNGNLSQTGVKRIEAALAAKAFDDTAFVARAFDSADSNIRGLAGALGDAAGPWAKMREAARSGDIDPAHDITHELMDVVHKVMRARDEGVSIADILKQNDMFGSDVKPLVESLLFRNVDNGALAARPRIASGLKTYAIEAEKNLAGPSLFGGGDDIKPKDIFKTALSKAAPDVEETVAAPTFESGAKEESSKPVPNFDKAALDRLTAAKDATKDRGLTHRNRIIKPILAKDGFESGPYKMLPSTVANKAVVRGDKGYEVAKAYLVASKNNKSAIEAMKDEALNQLRGKNLTKDDTIDPKKFSNWKHNYSGALKAIDEVSPGFSSKFNNAARATELVIEAGVKREQVLKEAQKSEAAKFLGVTDPTEVGKKLETIIASKTGPTQAKELIKSANGNQDVIEGLQKALVDRIVDKFKATTTSGTSTEKKLNKAPFDRFVRENDAALRVILPKESVNLLHAIVADADRSSRVLATNLSGSPATAMDFGKIASKMIKAAGDHKLLSGAILGAAAEGYMHSGSLTAALAAAGIAAPAWWIKTMRTAGINKVEDMFRDALLNPERARYYLAKQPPSQKPETGPLYAISRSIRRQLLSAPMLKDKDNRPAIGKYPAKKAA